MDDSAEEKENCVTNGEENVRQEVIVARDERSQLRKGDGRSALTKELIQAESKHFDVGAITLLRVSGRGLTNIGQDIAMCHSIVELDLSENKIDCVDGLEWLKALRKVVLSKNNLSNLGCLPRCPSLEHILLQANMFRDHPSEIASGLALLPKLRSLYLQNFDGSDANDCCGRHEYRNCVLQELPELCILDGERLRSIDTVSSMEIIRSIGTNEGGNRHNGTNTQNPSLIDEHDDSKILLQNALRQESLSVPQLVFDDIDCDVMPSAASEQRLASLIDACRDEQHKLSALITKWTLINSHHNRAHNNCC